MKSPVNTVARMFIAAMLLLSGPAFGQRANEDERFFNLGAPAQATGTEIVLEQRDKIAVISRKAEQLQTRILSNSDNDGVLVEIRNGLEGLARELIASGVAFRPRLAVINARLDEIGPVRGEGEPPEPATLTEERQSLVNEKAEINALLGEAEALSLRVNRMIEEIAQIRRDLFSNTLSRRYDIKAAISPEVLKDFGVESTKLYGAIQSWTNFVFNYKLSAVLLATLFALVAAGFLAFGGRRLFGNLIVPDPDVEEPSYLSRLSVAFWSTLVPSASLAVFLVATWFFYDYYGVLRRDIAQMMITLFNVIGIVYFIYRLSRAVFSPGLPAWRLLPIRTPAARILFLLTCLTALVTGADFVASTINEVMRSPLSLTVAKSFFATIIVGALVIVIGFVKPYEKPDGTPRSWHPALRGLVYMLGGGTILAALLGYIGLARFLSQQIVITGAILATMYIGYRSASAISEIGAFTGTKLGRRLDARFHFDEATEDQLGLVISIVINLLVLAIGIPLILLQWGFQFGDIQAWVYNVANEIRVGSISISLIGIVTGIVVFVLGYFGTRGFQRWLDGKVMARGRVDAGVRNSIGTAVGYAGIALAGLVGISAAGIDLSSIALVAGALSLGIGFGLQNIVNNFVSGLILLAERPFKVGDWIVASGTEGNVRKISVRATEIETFQRQTVIMPNSLLINAAVGNWTHRNRLGRVDIPVDVSSSNDPRLVHDVLAAVVAEQQGVLKNPAPVVSFTNFGETTLNFVIRVFVSDISSPGSLHNDLRFAIFERLREEGIALPSRDPALKGLARALRAGAEPLPAEEERVEAEKPVGRGNGRRRKPS